MTHASCLFLRLSLLGILLSQAGCVALNIPSQRVHDPDDQGGLLGHWPSTDAHSPRWFDALGVDDVSVHRGTRGSHGAAMHPHAASLAADTVVDGGIYYEGDPALHGHAASHPHGGSFHSRGGCTLPGCSQCGVADAYDPLAEVQPAKEEEVPWPRFHPVPTRPVFGGVVDSL